MKSPDKFEVRAVPQEEADQIPWLNNQKRTPLERPHPLKTLVDQILTTIEASETGVACLDLKMLEDEDVNVFQLPGQLRIISRERRGIELQTKTMREGGVGRLNTKQYPRIPFPPRTYMYIRRAPNEAGPK